MPSTPAPYTRVIKFGIPLWKDVNGSLYYYENSTLPTLETRILLGTETTGLVSDWEERLALKLAGYRDSQAARPRLVGKAAAAAAAAAKAEAEA